MPQLIRISIISALVFSWNVILTGCSNKIALTKNEYGLVVIKTIKDYKKDVEKSDSLRLKSLHTYVPNIKFEWFYATANNFTKKVLYKNPEAFLRIEAVEKLRKIALELELKGLGLLIFDAYRPYSITQKMWQIVPDENYAANPAKGSGHNRGAAIDLSLYDLGTGKPLEMPTPFDEFSEKAHHDYMDLPVEIIANRKLLKEIMLKYGFQPLNTEWWHYSLPNAGAKYALLDLNFNELRKLCK